MGPSWFRDHYIVGKIKRCSTLDQTSGKNKEKKKEKESCGGKRRKMSNKNKSGCNRRPGPSHSLSSPLLSPSLSPLDARNASANGSKSPTPNLD